LADKRLYDCRKYGTTGSPVVGFIKPKKLSNQKYNLCINERAMVHLLNSMGIKMEDPKSFKISASQGSIGYNSEKIKILL
jgi:hypothetical protein